MKKTDIQTRVYNLFDEQVPDRFTSVLSKCKEKERNDSMKKHKIFQGWWWKVSVACLFLVLLGGTYYFYQRNYLVDSVIQIDVNPSIQLEVNQKDKVMKCVALNDDAKDIIKDMDFQNVDIDVALNAIIGSMVTKGYLDDLSNSILISVDNNDEKKAEEMRQKLVEKIDNILNTDKINGSVLSQTLSNKEEKKEVSEAEALAEQYHISVGKAKLILDVVENNPLLKVEDLVTLSINEINVLTQGKEDSLSHVEKQGNASTKAYIGEEQAKNIALEHAKVTNPTNLKVEFDTEDGVIIYEVDFEDDTYEYEYEINALNGNVITSDKERRDDRPIENENSKDYISRDKAKEIAFNHAKVTSPKYVTVELDKEDGITVYQIEFEDSTYEYDYEINATNGTIVTSDKERKETASTNNSNNSSNFISSSKAKEIALNHAKVSNPQQLEVELDKEDREYSVEFHYNGYEYDYEIDAVTGKILKSEKERD